jgi:streptomycin 6-kinase
MFGQGVQVLGGERDHVHGAGMAGLVDDQAEELRLAHGGLHHGVRLLLGLGDSAGFVELGCEAVDGDNGLLGALGLQLRNALSDAVICCQPGRITSVSPVPCRCHRLACALALGECLRESFVALVRENGHDRHRATGLLAG